MITVEKANNNKPIDTIYSPKLPKNPLLKALLVKTADFTSDLPTNSKSASSSELLILIFPVKGTPFLFTLTSSAIDRLLRIVTLF